MPENITFVPGTLPPNPCYTSEQQRYNAYISQLQGSINSPSNVLIQQTTPDPDDRDKVWVQVDGSNRITGIFTFANGSWQTQYVAPVVNLAKMCFPFWGSIGDIVAPYYLCNGQTVTTPISGTVTVPDMPGRTVLGTGTAATGTNFPHLSTGGTETETLTVPQIPSHKHDSNDGGPFVVVGGSGTQVGTGGVNSHTEPNTAFTGGGQPHNNLPPYLAMYWVTFVP